MKNKHLVEMLSSPPSDGEICAEVYDTSTDKLLDIENSASLALKKEEAIK